MAGTPRKPVVIRVRELRRGDVIANGEGTPEVGVFDLDFVNGPDCTAVCRVYPNQAALDAGQPRVIEHPCTNEDGTARWVRVLRADCDCCS